MVVFLALLLPILAPVITWGSALLVGTFFVTFALKAVIQIIFLVAALMVLVNYVKKLPEYKGRQHAIPILLFIGLLIAPILLGSFGRFIGLASYVPIVPYQIEVGAADISCLAIGCTNTSFTTIDLALICAVIIVIWLWFTKSGEKYRKKYIKFLGGK